MTGKAGGNYLLDTNIVIAYFNREQAIRDRLQNEDVQFFVPSIGLGELYFGAFNSARQESNLKQIRDFISLVPIIDCDGLTAQLYGQLKRDLLAKGRPIPENDIWIAAIAKQHDLTLVTRDDHFEQVDDLTRERWS